MDLDGRPVTVSDDRSVCDDPLNSDPFKGEPLNDDPLNDDLDPASLWWTLYNDTPYYLTVTDALEDLDKRELFQGAQLLIGDGPVQVLLQLSRGERLWPDGRLRKCFVVQQISTNPKKLRKGHASQLLEDLKTVATNNDMGVMVQSVFTGDRHHLPKLLQKLDYKSKYDCWFSP